MTKGRAVVAPRVTWLILAASALTAAGSMLGCSGDSGGGGEDGGGSDSSVGVGGDGGADAAVLDGRTGTGQDATVDATTDGASSGGGDSSDATGGDATAVDGPAGDGSGGDARADVSYGSVGPIVQVQLPGANIPKFVDALPAYSGRRISGADGGITVNMVEFQQKVLPASVYASLPAPFSAGTYLWGYDVNGTGPSWPATTIEAQRGAPTTVTYTNSLQGPNATAPVLQKYLIADQTIHNADPLGITKNNACVGGPPLASPCLETYPGPIPATVHLHGAEVPSQFDGHPDSWFTPSGGLFGLLRGPAYVSNVYTYPNGQEATALWFHDHALGRTRLSVYSGLAGFYLLRDARDTGLATNPIGLPAGPYEEELLVADRQFDDKGQLYFPNGEPGNAQGLNGGPPNPDHHPFWIPEFFGDVVTVNGKSWPYLDVQPRRYRFRVLNASNARFMHMTLVDTTGNDGGAPPATGPDGGGFPPGLPIWQIGSDGGFFNAPVRLDPAVVDTLYTNFITQLGTGPTPIAQALFLAPAERADIIVDFGGHAGKTFTLVNDGLAPFPSGGTTLDPAANGEVMQFRVVQPLAGADASFNPAAGPVDAGAMGALRAQPIVNIRPPGGVGGGPPGNPAAAKRRQLVLVEVELPAFVGVPEEAMLNNSHWDGIREGTSAIIDGGVSNGAGLSSTENPQLGTTELWEIANLTADAHPVHIHLVQFQMINRQELVLGDPTNPTTSTYRGAWNAAFPGGSFLPGYGPPRDYGTANGDGALGGNVAFGAAGPAMAATYPSGYFAAAPLLPEPEERGWKDTIKALPGWITRIAIRWAPQDVPATGAGAPVAGTNLFSFDPTLIGPGVAPGYAWHCHILDHEDNEMMRPYLVTH